MNKKRKIALVSGVTGQDGSYLTEFLLKKGYEVHGIIRRSSSFNTGRIDHIYQDPHDHHARLFLHYGDLSDANSLNRIVQEVKPEEIYNLGAMSHVKVSFDKPEYTADVTGLGVLRMLESIRSFVPKCRFLQASSSELFGIPYEVPQNELTRFHPRSPYGVAKQFGYSMTVNYRESYGIHATNSICYNHECFDANTPIIIKNNDLVSVEYIRNLLPERKDITKDNNVLTRDIENLEIWNGYKFVKAKTITRRKMHTLDLSNHRKNVYNSRHGAVKVTPNHKLLSNSGEKKQAESFIIGDKLKHGEFPKIEQKTLVLLEEAELLGMLVGDGYVSGNDLRFTNLDIELLMKFYSITKQIYGNVLYRINEGTTEYGYSRSIDISGVGKNRLNALREEIYDLRSNHKKVPLRVLNGNKEIKEAFFRGYYACDGLKKDKCTYEFKSIKSNSPILCQGLLLVMNDIKNQDYNINVFNQNGKEYYQINFNSDRETKEDCGSHFILDREGLKKVTDSEEDINCFVYDIETECGYLNAGVGAMIVGNSPKRGETFVTRKITRAVSAIKLGLQDCLYLGNMYSRRDWGYAPCFIEAMWLMLQQDKPDDYVIATGETHSIKEFVNIAFDLADLSLKWEGEGDKEVGINKKDGRVLVQIDPKYYRPAEVDLLLGDYSKAKKALGWEPKVKFNELVEIMYKADYEEMKNMSIKSKIKYDY